MPTFEIKTVKGEKIEIEAPSLDITVSILLFEFLSARIFFERRTVLYYSYSLLSFSLSFSNFLLFYFIHPFSLYLIDCRV
jgi:hypothetical protein